MTPVPYSALCILHSPRAHLAAYEQFADQDLLQSVTAVLKRYQRFTL